MKKILLNIILFICALTTTPGAQEVQSVNDYFFEIKEVGFGEWAKGPHHMTNDWVQKAQDSQKLSYISISYQLTNNNETKKIDLTDNLHFQLVDEFKNHYRQIKKPADFAKPVLSVSKNFPSIYPGETYGETLFFEAPLAKAREVNLIIDAGPLGVLEPIELTTQLDRPLQDKAPQLATQAVAVNPQLNTEMSKAGDGLMIAWPENATVFEQGDLIHLRVNVADKTVPAYILIDTLNYTFEDRAPQKDNIYDINIPTDQKPGPVSVNVIGVWQSGTSEKSTKSDNIIIYVKGSSPLDVL